MLIDNYIDDTVLKRLDKRADGVEATIYTDHISRTLAVDIATHNKEYAPIDVIEMNKSHDRFLIIDDDHLVVLFEKFKFVPLIFSIPIIELPSIICYF